MSSNKAALKAAKAALDGQNYDEAITQAQAVLDSDANNYFAKLFLGRAYDKQNKPDQSAKAYIDATKSKPEDDQAWLGLRVLYEGHGSQYISEYIDVCVRLAQVYEAADDRHKCQSVMDKMMGFVKSNGTKSQLKKALETQLPTSPIYSYLEGRFPAPNLTYTRLAEITEEEEKEKINKEIGERRTRLGARKEQVTADVRREVFTKSDLEDIYREIINWTNDDEVRREFEEKLLRRAYDTLLVLGHDQKSEKREQVLKLAHDMVVIKHPFELAWSLELEWANFESISEFDVGILREYCAFFPGGGLAKILKSYLGSEISPFPSPPPNTGATSDSDDDDDMHGGGVTLMGQEDRLVFMSDGLESAKDSALAHRLMAEYYQHLEEYESVVETVRSGLKLHEAERRKSGLAMQKSLDAFNTLLATALIYYQTPRNHAEAKMLFNNILSRKPLHTEALIGSGLILEEEESYPEAIDYFEKALKRDPHNSRIGAELAWCRALNGELERGLHELQEYLQKMNPADPKTRDMRAETMYRIGKCQWDIDPTRASRKDRTGPYAQFLACVKTNINYGPAYTMLGLYYEDYARDKKRARQCFQKAFDLSGSEVLAAERLARSYADQGDWEIVEIISQRVVDSGKTRPPPGSKRKGISWPYSALGVVQMNKQEYQQAIVSFLAALRISPDDYHSYIGLGESYHNSGRYNSSLRTFNFAENPGADVQMKKTGDSWFTKYMLANVNRELMNYDDAIVSYKNVLTERPHEFGVEIALLQTLLEKAWHSVETGFFGRAADSANEAIDIAASIVESMPGAFNLWKAVADACSVFTWVQHRSSDFPFEKVCRILGHDIEDSQFDMFALIGGAAAKTPSAFEKVEPGLEAAVQGAILAQKRAIISCAHDVHAQAVAWYNLGWNEHRAHVVAEQSRDGPQSDSKKASMRFLKAGVRCFKRAIELEAGNAEFWNSLGVMTTSLNSKVAQHAFVRSLHLNERNVKAWTNLGTLYLLQNDLELAHKAFTRAQSTDPDYAHAWIGEGIVALLYGDPKEALLHFTHAFEISDMATTITKEAFAAYSFDQATASAASISSTLDLIRPLYALQQLRTLRTNDSPYDHLTTIYQERTADYEPAITNLTSLCTKFESDYESTESPISLARFAQAKSDLARSRLAARDYEAAATDAETALDLTTEPIDPKALSSTAARKLRLSAHLSLGLAHYYLQDMDAAVSAFKAALEESEANPDVVCALAQVLWAKGGREERDVAKEQLFACVEAQPEHVGAVVLLGVMAVLDEDEEAIEAIREELLNFRVSSKLNALDQDRIEKVLSAMAELSAAQEPTSSSGAVDPIIQVAVFLHPWKSAGWSKLASMEEGSDDAYAARMALKAAERNVPPRGKVDAEELAEALAGTNDVKDAMEAVFVAPWKGEGWRSLADCVRI